MTQQLRDKKEGSPRLTTCCRCGVETGAVLLGLLKKPGKIEEAALARALTRPYEKVALDLCQKCRGELDSHKAKVQKEGGVYWRCVKCHSGGVISGHSELAKALRAQQGVPPPGPCAIEFDEGCPAESLKDPALPPQGGYIIDYGRSNSTGDGDGAGYGYGAGYGCGNGSGRGYGDGYGCGYGTGDGHGHGRG